MAEPKIRIGEILVRRGVIDPATAELIEAERLLARSRFLSAAVAHGRVSEVDALTALAVRDGVPSVDLSRAVIATRVAKRVPLAVARKRLILPVREEGGSLLVAMADPTDRKLADEISFATGMQVLPHAALHSRLLELIPKAHAAPGPFVRGPLAPAGAPDAESVPIITERSGPAAPEIEVIVDELEELEPLADAVGGETPNRASPGREGAEPRAPSSRAAAPGRGGTERAAPAAVGAGGGGAVPPASAARKTVLVVEDEPAIAKLVSTCVEKLGHEAVTVGRGLEALRLIKLRRPDLIVLDAMLPEVHGFEICRKVKESKRFGATPVLMVSAIYRGWRMAEDIKETYKADAFLEKPFRMGDLRRVMEQLLSQQTAAPDDGEPLATSLVEAAQQALARGAAAEALRQLRQAETLEPFSPKVQFLIAQALEKLERPLEALYRYERAIELRPGFFLAAKSAAVLYQARGFRNKATEMWERALRAAPADDVRAQIKQHLMSLL